MRWTRIAMLTHPLRRLWWLVGWGALRIALCPRLEVTGWHRIPAAAVVFAANHTSHADTVILEHALARRGRDRVMAAAAEDYFFSSRRRGVAAAVLAGAYPFPRSGTAGLAATQGLLDRGWSIILYPQGSRRGGRFRSGVGVLLREGATVVPVRIDGTGRMLPHGHLVPRRSAVRIEFGQPIVAFDDATVGELTRQVETVVLGEAA